MMPIWLGSQAFNRFWYGPLHRQRSCLPRFAHAEAITLHAPRDPYGGAFHIQNVAANDCRLKGWFRRLHGGAAKYLMDYQGGGCCKATRIKVTI